MISSDDLENCPGILDRIRQHSDVLISQHGTPRRSRHPAEGGFESHHTAKRGRSSDRTARIGAERRIAGSGCDRRRAATAAAPRGIMPVHGIMYRFSGIAVDTCPPGELPCLRLAGYHGPSLAQAPYRYAISVCRLGPGHCRRTVAGRHSLDIQHILDAHDDAVYVAHRHAVPPPAGRRFRLSDRGIDVDKRHGVAVDVLITHPGQLPLKVLNRGQRSGPVLREEMPDRLRSHDRSAVCSLSRALNCMLIIRMVAPMPANT